MKGYLTLSVLYKFESVFQQPIRRSDLEDALDYITRERMQGVVDDLIDEAAINEKGNYVETNQMILLETFKEEVKRKEITISQELMENGWFTGDQRAFGRRQCKPTLPEVLVRSKSSETNVYGSCLLERIRYGPPFLRPPPAGVDVKKANVKILPLVHRHNHNYKLITSTIEKAKKESDFVVLILPSPGSSYALHVLGANFTSHAILGSSVEVIMFGQLSHVEVRHLSDGSTRLSSVIQHVVSPRDDLSQLLLAPLDGDVVAVPAGPCLWKMRAEELQQFSAEQRECTEVAERFSTEIEDIYGENGEHIGKEETNERLVELFHNARKQMKTCERTNRIIEQQFLSRLKDAFHIYGDTCPYIIACGAIHAKQIEVKLEEGFSYVPTTSEYLITENENKLRAKMRLIPELMMPYYPSPTFIRLFGIKSDEIEAYSTMIQESHKRFNDEITGNPILNRRAQELFGTSSVHTNPSNFATTET